MSTRKCRGRVFGKSFTDKVNLEGSPEEINRASHGDGSGKIRWKTEGIQDPKGRLYLICLRNCAWSRGNKGDGSKR